MKTATALLYAAMVCSASTIHAADVPHKTAPFTGTDIGGVYACTGVDAHDGKFAYAMTVTLDRPYSSGQFGSYKAKMTGEHDGYTGAIVSNGQQLALTFANNDAAKKDDGVALATVTRLPHAKFRIEKFYYEAQYSGGSNGFETCTLK